MNFEIKNNSLIPGSISKVDNLKKHKIEEVNLKKAD